MATSLPSLPAGTTRITARRVLVLAPHFDDELLGCGGLLIQLAAGGAEVRVLFLSDGSGGEEEVGDRAAYTARRRGEAQAVARLLRFAGTEELGACDGSLAAERQRIGEGIRAALLSHRPDLLLVPSPSEITTDHRAAFLALCDVLSPLRDGDEMHAVMSGATVFLYEVNQPAHPDHLVDVGAEMHTFEEAMRLYASRLERHNYLDGALGLRRYRAQFLSRELRAVEGYRRVDLSDFTTRSPSQLFEHLGGVAPRQEVEGGALVSVIVRTYNRPDFLREALGSLAASHYRRLEVVLVNDGGAPPNVPASYPFAVTRIDLPENRGRGVAAQSGVDAATGTYIAFLDDDDLLAPEHFSTLVGAASAGGVRVVYSDAAVGIYALGPNGWECRARGLPFSRDFDPDFLLLDNYIPLNTLLIERALCLEAGPFDADLPFFEDWDFLIRLSAACAFHHVRRVTCEYRQFEGGQQVLGAGARARPDLLDVKARVLAKHAARLTPERITRAVDTLKLEASECGELRRKLEALTGRDDLQQHLGRTYAEIERLNGVVAALENHPALKLYRRLRGVGR